ncbi:hypothetical protein H2199_003937 [Coniosporium tulheliwenetii]|uniref:Uncharacterized protein n=1 Tax=Coniosporium tulheliwenetii TaxID=3383036 RepID=A0ACC2Z935_9PEZI|nr:hypothetical protein H2199_003937 [Cladosporium sp. JES 115]
MAALTLTVFVCLSLVAIRWYRSFRANLASAKASGLPYVIVPITNYQIFWVFTGRLFLVILCKLPESWAASWIDFVKLGWSSRLLHQHFTRFGCNAFLTVSPFSNVLWVCDAIAITQITSRTEDFEKPTIMKKILDIFGENILTSGGDDWRRHRKVVSPIFAEKHNQIIWEESIHQASHLRKYLLSTHMIKGGKIDDIAPGEMTLDSARGLRSRRSGNANPLGFGGAFNGVLDNLASIASCVQSEASCNLAVEKPPLRVPSLRGVLLIHLHHHSLKNVAVVAKRKSGEMDLLEALISSNRNLADDASHVPSRSVLSDTEITGNTFSLIVAGHKTTAQAMYQLLALLAIHPSIQKDIQRSLDSHRRIEPASPSVDTSCISNTVKRRYNVQALLNDIPGAALLENLRLFPPVANLPRRTVRPQRLQLEDGRTVTVPADTEVNITIGTAHRNPNQWPRYDLEDADDLHKFNPGRWMRSDRTKEIGVDGGHHIDARAEERKDSGYRRPQKGAFLPFGEGMRACPGRRFARTEIMAVLAVLLSEHSIELAVPELDEAGLKALSDEERKRVWLQARDRAMATLNATKGLALKLGMKEEVVPVKLVERGKEMFYDF